MISLQSKNLVPLRIMQILAELSDSEHLLTQADIVRRLGDYSIAVDRKTVQRQLTNLQIAGFDIVTTPKGCYLNERDFDNSELKLLMDYVSFDLQIPEVYANALVNKLAKLGSKHFAERAKRQLISPVGERSDNKDFFYNIDVITEAIATHRGITFRYAPSKEENIPAGRKTMVAPQMFVFRDNFYCVVCIVGRRTCRCYQIRNIHDLQLAPREEFNVRTFLDSSRHAHCKA